MGQGNSKESHRAHIAYEIRLSKLGHQEISRILEELDAMSAHVQEAAGDQAWITVDSAENMVISSLGYEDKDQFQSVIQGDFVSFIKSLPHLETKIQEEPGLAHGKLVFRTKPLPPLSQRVSFTKKVHVTSTRELWRVLSRSKATTVEIPSIGFEIKPCDKRSVDTLYNHIAKAKFELESIAKTEDPTHKDKIAETACKLGDLLDVKEPFDILVHDPTGTSMFFPDEGVETVKMGLVSQSSDHHASSSAYTFSSQSRSGLPIH